MLRLLAVALMVATPAAAQRLPGTVLPDHYTLSFEPDLAATPPLPRGDPLEHSQRCCIQRHRFQSGW